MVVGVVGLQFVAMEHGIVNGVFVEHAFSDQVGVELAVEAGIDGDEEVGHDASAAIDGAAVVGFVFQ